MEAGDEPKKHRATYLSVSQAFNLNVACRALSVAFGHCTYHVGSSLDRVDYRDVDLRCILDDAEYDSMFGAAESHDLRLRNHKLRFLNVAVSDWIAARTGLPIDFQFQRMTEANKEFRGRRNFIGH